MRIGIANDLVIATEALRRLLARTQHEVVWIAHNGVEAVQYCQTDRPDLVLMDLHMPQMDGIEATRHIMQQSPCAILIVTATPDSSTGSVFRAMGAGALDVTATPVLSGSKDGGELLKKIATIERLVRNARKAPASVATPARPALAPPGKAGTQLLLAIGASTGGPTALVKVISECMSPRIAIVIVQHIDQRFADGFAKWLAEQVKWPCNLIDAGTQAQAGHIHIARANDHLTLTSSGQFDYNPNPADYAYRPSIDVFLTDVARHWRGKALGVLLTGMGRDGALGLLAMREAGYLTITQDQASCAVYGMPRAAAELHAATWVLPLDEIGRKLKALCVVGDED